MAVYSISLVAPALSLEPESKLPACCRRDGKHGCGMMKKSRSEQSSGPAVKSSMHCDSYPTGNAVPAAGKVVVAHPPRHSFASTFSDPHAIAQTEAHYRESARRAWQVRGPPAHSLV
jgi:hypothetical protein